MMQGWPIGSGLTTTGCTGVSLTSITSASIGWKGISGINWSVTPTPTVKLEVGKIYKCKQPFVVILNKRIDTCIKVFGPTKMCNGEEVVRMKFWDSEFKEWDQNMWVTTKQPESAVEEIGRLEALVVYGAVG